MIMSHVFMMAPVHRYLLVLSHGFNARRSKKIDDYQVCKVYYNIHFKLLQTLKNFKTNEQPKL